jgi:hypothetical protein
MNYVVTHTANGVKKNAYKANQENISGSLFFCVFQKA